MYSATPTTAKCSMVGRYYDRWLQAHEPIDKMARRLNWRAIYVWTVTLARGHPWYWCRPYSSLRPRGINKSTLIFNNLLYNDIIFDVPTYHAFRRYQRAYLIAIETVWTIFVILKPVCEEIFLCNPRISTVTYIHSTTCRRGTKNIQPSQLSSNPSDVWRR